jgi:hypothetical protein
MINVATWRGSKKKKRNKIDELSENSDGGGKARKIFTKMAGKCFRNDKLMVVLRDGGVIRRKRKLNDLEAYKNNES